MADTVRARFHAQAFHLHHCQWEERPLHCRFAPSLPLLITQRGGGVPAV